MRLITGLLVLAATQWAAVPFTLRFEGMWKAADGTVLCILSDNPPRGTFARSEDGMKLFIQDTRIVKGGLQFKTIDPNEGVVQYQMKVLSPNEARLSEKGREDKPLHRN